MMQTVFSWVVMVTITSRLHNSESSIIVHFELSTFFWTFKVTLVIIVMASYHDKL